MTIVVKKIDNLNAVARTLILGSEGNNPTPSNDINDHTITLGYGYTFVRKGMGDIWSVVSTLTDDLLAAEIGVRT